MLKVEHTNATAKGFNIFINSFSKYSSRFALCQYQGDSRDGIWSRDSECSKPLVFLQSWPALPTATTSPEALCISPPALSPALSESYMTLSQ